MCNAYLLVEKERRINTMLKDFCLAKRFEYGKSLRGRGEIDTIFSCSDVTGWA